jgi:Zn-dependent protease
MFTPGIPLFKLFGFQIKLAPSWFILAALLIWTLSAGFFLGTYPGLRESTYLWMGVVVVIGFFASIVLHEFAHAWVASLFGLPMHGITLFVFGGVAEMEEEPDNPLIEFLMAIAGPATSLLILLAFAGCTILAINQGLPTSVIGVFSYLAIINGMLLVFNLVPAFPLDGGRILRSILWGWRKDLEWATRIASRLGGWFGGLLIVLGILNLFQGEFVDGMWEIFIGFFLRQAAEFSYQQVLTRQGPRGDLGSSP